MTKNLNNSANDQGYTVITEETDSCTVTWIKIISTAGVEMLGKPVGNYITIELNEVEIGKTDKRDKITGVLTGCLSRLMNLKDDDAVLVVGLGNDRVLPDALGPRSAEKVIATSHLIGFQMEDSKFGIRPVSVIKPGVMGDTGIDTREIVKGVCDRVNPSLVIIIDALAASAVQRFSCTIQLSDAEIVPGTGTGNRRGVINSDFLGVPVISIGVPTTLNAAVLVRDTFKLALDAMLENDNPSGKIDKNPYEYLTELTSSESRLFVQSISRIHMSSMFLTPNNIDDVVEYYAYIISEAINHSLNIAINQDTAG